MKFRKKPVVIEASQFRGEIQKGGQGAPLAVPDSFLGYPVHTDDRGAYLIVPTLEGPMRANDGDWIVTGIKGERYPVKPEIFEATYEAAG